MTPSPPVITNARIDSQIELQLLRGILTSSLNLHFVEPMSSSLLRGSHSLARANPLAAFIQRKPLSGWLYAIRTETGDAESYMTVLGIRPDYQLQE